MMKVLYFAPKPNFPIVRSLFRAHDFKGASTLDELIRLMCDPFILCLFDLDFCQHAFKSNYEHFKTIFGDKKILPLEFNKRDSKIFLGNETIRAKEFALLLDDLELNEKP